MFAQLAPYRRRQDDCVVKSFRRIWQLRFPSSTETECKQFHYISVLFQSFFLTVSSHIFEYVFQTGLIKTCECRMWTGSVWIKDQVQPPGIIQLNCDIGPSAASTKFKDQQDWEKILWHCYWYDGWDKVVMLLILHFTQESIVNCVGGNGQSRGAGGRVGGRTDAGLILCCVQQIQYWSYSSSKIMPVQCQCIDIQFRICMK